MKKETTGTHYVPVHRTTDGKFNSLINYFLPEECKVRSQSDFYYVTAIALASAGFIYPPLFIGAVACVVAAKKGGQNDVFVQYLNTYAPKNRAWLKLTNYIAKFKYVLVKDELARTALVEELRNKVNEMNKQYSKLKPFHFHAGLMGESLRVDVSVTKNGCPDMVL